MSEDQEPVHITPDVQVIIDKLGDPYLSVNITVPPHAALTADQVERMALQLLASVAMARTRAAVVRKQLFAGIPPQEAVAFAGEMLD